MDTPRLRIGFDARLAGPAHAGIGRYGEELLRQIVFKHSLSGQKVTWVIWLSPNHGMPWLEEAAAAHEIELRITTVPHYGFLEQTSWVWELQSAGLDLLHVPHFNVPLAYVGLFVVTIHDLLWHTQRDPNATTLSPLWHRIKHSAYRFVSESAIRRAKAVIVPSETVREEVVEITGRNGGITVTYEGIPYVFRQSVISDKKKENFLVYTGSLYPHKNLEIVLQALQKLPDLRLKVASTRSVFTEKMQERAKKLGVEKQVEWLGFVPDEDLIELYRRARALIQPSKSEGFGLTGLEAMSVDCPVVASDISIFREVYGDHAVLFNPQDVYSLISSLGRTRSRDDLQSARVYARGFSWQRMADQTLEVYNTVLARPNES